MFTTKDRYHVCSFYESLLHVAYVSLLYFVFALYFDNIFSSNRGASQPPLFFLSPNYWLSFLKLSIKFGANKPSGHRRPFIEKANVHGHMIAPNHLHHAKANINTAQEEKESIQ